MSGLTVAMALGQRWWSGWDFSPGTQQVCNIGRLARLRQPSLSTAVPGLGRSGGPDVALVRSNPGVGERVSNQCDAARAGPKCVVARLGVQRPDRGLDAIQYDPAHCVLGYSPRVCYGWRGGLALPSMALRPSPARPCRVRKGDVVMWRNAKDGKNGCLEAARTLWFRRRRQCREGRCGLTQTVPDGWNVRNDRV